MTEESANYNQPNDRTDQAADLEKQKIEREEILKTIDTGTLKKSDFEQRIENLISKGRKRGRRYSVIGIATSVLVCLAVLLLGYYLINQITTLVGQVDKETGNSLLTDTGPVKKELVIPRKWRECVLDSECVLTRENCCDCSQGGYQTGINNSFLNSWTARLSAKCTNKQCPGENKCLDGSIACWEKNCVFIPGLKPCVAFGNEIMVDATSTDSQACCDNLQAILDGGSGKYICAGCGNAACEIPENETNCPEDCAQATTTADTILGPAAVSDADNDKLTDIEEQTYGTDAGNPDTDGDGFLDGDEVTEGYDPAAKNPSE